MIIIIIILSVIIFVLIEIILTSKKPNITGFCTESDKKKIIKAIDTILSIDDMSITNATRRMLITFKERIIDSYKEQMI